MRSQEPNDGGDNVQQSRLKQRQKTNQNPSDHIPQKKRVKRIDHNKLRDTNKLTWAA